jgi:hypothetical protein
MNPLVHFREEGLSHCGLPRPHFAGEKDKALPLDDSISQKRESFLVSLSQIKKARGRGKVERLLFQIKETFIHFLFHLTGC